MRDLFKKKKSATEAEIPQEEEQLVERCLQCRQGECRSAKGTQVPSPVIKRSRPCLEKKAVQEGLAKENNLQVFGTLEATVFRLSTSGCKFFIDILSRWVA